MIAAWLARRKAAARQREQDNGWDWAAGRLLAGWPVEAVEQWAGYGTCFDGRSAFDDGIFAACAAWEKK